MASKTATQEEREELYKFLVKELPSFFAPKLPDMSNYTPARLIELNGKLKDVEKDLKKVTGLLNGIIDSKLTPEEKLLAMSEELVLRSETYELKMDTRESVRLKPEKARDQLRRLATEAGEDPDTIVASCEEVGSALFHTFHKI